MEFNDNNLKKVIVELKNNLLPGYQYVQDNKSASLLPGHIIELEQSTFPFDAKADNYVKTNIFLSHKRSILVTITDSNSIKPDVENTYDFISGNVKPMSVDEFKALCERTVPIDSNKYQIDDNGGLSITVPFEDSVMLVDNINRLLSLRTLLITAVI